MLISVFCPVYFLVAVHACNAWPCTNFSCLQTGSAIKFAFKLGTAPQGDVCHRMEQSPKDDLDAGRILKAKQRMRGIAQIHWDRGVVPRHMLAFQLLNWQKSIICLFDCSLHFSFSPNSLLLRFYLGKKELATLTGAALNSVAGLCGWALCPGLVLLLSSVAGLCSVPRPCPPWMMVASSEMIVCSLWADRMG